MIYTTSFYFYRIFVLVIMQIQIIQQHLSGEISSSEFDVYRLILTAASGLKRFLRGIHTYIAHSTNGFIAKLEHLAPAMHKIGEIAVIMSAWWMHTSFFLPLIKIR